MTVTGETIVTEFKQCQTYLLNVLSPGMCVILYSEFRFLMKYFFEFIDKPNKLNTQKIFKDFEEVLNRSDFTITENKKPVVPELRTFVYAMEFRYRNIWHFKLK